MGNFLNHLTERCKGPPEDFGNLDHDKELFTRYLYNLSKQTVGYQQYNWKGDKKTRNRGGRYYTYLSGTCPQAQIGLMGLDNIRYGETLYLVEGMFEQITGTRYGINCVAVLCNNPKHAKEWLRIYPGKIVHLAQPGPIGLDMPSLTDEIVQLSKDLDEYTLEEFNSLQLELRRV